MKNRSAAPSNRFDGVVVSSRPSDPHAWLSVGKLWLAARKWAGIEQGEKITIYIRPEDVLLSDGYPGRISARNILPGKVRSLKRLPDGVRVTLDVGVPLVSLVTGETVAELGLRVGSAVYGIVKATAITPLVTFKAKYRVSLVGPKGLLGPEAIDLLRAVAAAGSLSAAAKELGISSKTALQSARAINRSWVRPLFSPEDEGASALTPEGAAAVAFADRLESGQ
jgi:molybdopterin-binding protein/molybdate transport repressor ModE-like protein